MCFGCVTEHNTGKIGFFFIYQDNIRESSCVESLRKYSICFYIGSCQMLLFRSYSIGGKKFSEVLSEVLLEVLLVFSCGRYPSVLTAWSIFN
ncbi:hypothetical protein RIR_jg3361.t1 [Rhizophagus irregularis DAOM 181602=DAOM 197198]|nr:hypothetical protein RIR_jg3361.t1 [Rhizophagus irregularis DAOM 181602=DAOM 197198]